MDYCEAQLRAIPSRGKQAVSTWAVGFDGASILWPDLVQNRPRPRDDGRMPRFVPIEVPFKGRHFHGQIIILVPGGHSKRQSSAEVRA